MTTKSHTSLIIDETHRVPVAHPSDRFTREELAMQMRTRMRYRDGRTYISAEPNWAAADAIIHGPGETYEQPWIAGSEHRYESGFVALREGQLGSVGRRSEPMIIGGDGRVLANTNVSPHNAIIRLKAYNPPAWGLTPEGANNSFWCSASYIGPWTVLTSAHCIYNEDVSPASERIAKLLRFYVKLAGSTSEVIHECTNYTLSSIAVPAGYTSFSGTNHLDYAVIDTYPCHSSPYAFAGVLVNPNDATYTGFGYPGSGGSCPGAPSGSNTYQCGMTGNAYDDWHRIETEHIDTFQGQSGGPWYIGNYAAGPLSGERTYFDFGRCGFDSCRRNFIRAIQTDVLGFIQTNSFDY